MVDVDECKPNEAWWESPIVSNAMKRLDAEDRLTGLDLLEAVHRDLTELEERFPGIPFKDIYNAPKAHLPTVRRAMQAAGVAPEDVVLVCGSVRNPVASKAMRFMPGSQTPCYTSVEVFEALRTGVTVVQLAEVLGISKGQAEWPHSFRTRPSEREQECLDVLFDHPDWSIRKVAGHVGVSRPTVQRALCKQSYWNWLATNYPEDLAVAA